VLYSVNVAAGIFISAIELYYKLSNLVDASFAPFQAECSAFANFWWNDMWDARLSSNSMAYETLVVGCCRDGQQCGAPAHNR
jgi:hypothetical protein